MKRVYIARGVSEAHLVRVYLESSGIAAIVRGEDLSTVFGGIPIDADSLPSVWVLDTGDVDRAMDLIRETSQDAWDRGADFRGDSEATDWQCPNCGETIDSVLLVCWNCGTDRPPEQ